MSASAQTNMSFEENTPLYNTSSVSPNQLNHPAHGKLTTNRIEMRRWHPQGWSSLFLPCLPSGMGTEENIKDLLQYGLCVGEVRRVDIVCNKEENKKMAFVHFNCWYNTILAIDMHKILSISDSEQFRLPLMNMNTGKYDNFVFMRNRAPIEETDLNIHQMSDLYKTLAKKNEELEKTVAVLMERLDKMENASATK